MTPQIHHWASESQEPHERERYERERERERERKKTPEGLAGPPRRKKSKIKQARQVGIQQRPSGAKQNAGEAPEKGRDSG